MRSAGRKWAFVSSFFAACLLFSCSDRPVYDEYQHVPAEGWERGDSRLFAVSPVAEGGLFDVAISLRTTAAYPFMSLALVVETEIVDTNALGAADSRTKADTLRCPITDVWGRSKGQGVSLHQFNFPAWPVNLRAGDSLCVRVRHCMRRNLLPGVCDLGVCLTRREK